MSTKPVNVYDADRVNQIRQWVGRCRNISEVLDILVDRLKVHRDSARRLNRTYHFWKVDSASGPATGARPFSAEEIKALDGYGIPRQSQGQTEVATTTPTASSLEEVVKLCKVDEAIWRPKSFAVEQRRTGFAWRVSLERKPQPVDLEALAIDFVAKAEAHAPTDWLVRAAPDEVNDTLLEIACFDIHIGRLCWGVETGGPDYDIKIAQQLVRDAVINLLESARGLNVGRILLPIGNDLFNSDNSAGTTTAGTAQAQSQDSRWPKIFDTGCTLMTDVIEGLSAEFPVDVIVVAGNHDRERCFYMGQYIKSWFRTHPNVTVNNEPTLRKYYRFGQNLIGFTHGSEEKVSDLPGIMAAERGSDWGETTYHEVHLGHQHRTLVAQYPGCTVRHIASMTPPDEWMAAKGYVGNPQRAEAFVFDPDKGLLATFLYTV